MLFHPNVGNRKFWTESRSKKSFAGRAAVICDREDSEQDALALVENIAKNLEMHLIYMNADAHDVHTAYISHISHHLRFGKTRF